MSKATNTVTFGKATRVELGDLFSDERAVLTNNGLYGRGNSRSAKKKSYRRMDVFADGKKIGALLEVLHCKIRVYFGFEDGDRGLGLDGFRFESWAGRLSLREGKSVLIAHMEETDTEAETVEATEEAAQVDTVEVEEPAQAFAPGDAVIATYKGAQTRGVVVCEYVCPDHRKGYPDERFYSSPEDPVYVVQERGEEREIAYRASYLERYLEAHA